MSTHHFMYTHIYVYKRVGPDIADLKSKKKLAETSTVHDIARTYCTEDETAAVR